MQGDRLLVDNTMLATWRRCPRRFDYAWVRRRVPKRRSTALTAGAAFAAAMQMFRAASLAGVAPGRAVDAAREALRREFDGVELAEVPPQHRPDRVEAGLAAYFSAFPPALVAAETVETDLFLQRGVLPAWRDPAQPGRALPETVYCGRLDALVRDEDGQLWVLEEKTSARAVSAEEAGTLVRLSGQMLGYAWLASAHYGTVAGVKYRCVVLRKEPTVVSASVRLGADYLAAFERELRRDLKLLRSELLHRSGVGGARYFVRVRRERVLHWDCCMCPYRLPCAWPEAEAGLLETEFEENTWDPSQGAFDGEDAA